MGLKREEKEIGGLTFAVEQFAVRRAQKLLMSLLKLAGGHVLSFAVAAGMTDAKTALSVFGGMKLEELAALLSDLWAKLEPDVMEALSKEILASTKVRHVKDGEIEGKWVDYFGVADAVMSSVWDHLAVQAFALSVHFGNFSGARGALEGLGLTASPSPASSTSNASTDSSS